MEEGRSLIRTLHLEQSFHKKNSKKIQGSLIEKSHKNKDVLKLSQRNIQIKYTLTLNF